MSKRGRGRPSKYRKEYCELLVSHMEGGLSFESFAAEVGVIPDTLYEWVKKHPEFSDAKKRGWALSQLFWEKIGIAGATGRIRGFNAASWIFNMKNRFKWRDLQPEEQAQQQSDNVKDAMRALDEEERKKKAEGQK